MSTPAETQLTLKEIRDKLMREFLEAVGTVYVDGHMMDIEDATVSILAHGLHYSGTNFEGEKGYVQLYGPDGNLLPEEEKKVVKIYQSDRHSHRLLKSCNLTRFDTTIEIKGEERLLDVRTINEAKEAVLKANQDKFGDEAIYFRAFGFRGPALGVNAKKPESLSFNHFGVATVPMRCYFGKDVLERGLTLQTADFRLFPAGCAPLQAKNAAMYLTRSISAQEANDAGFDDALMLDYWGKVGEVSVANIFMIKNGVIYTPTADRFLNGITRQSVIQMAREMGYTVHEIRMSPEFLRDADEVFSTGSATEIVPVSWIDDKLYKLEPVDPETAAPGVDFKVAGPHTAVLMNAYARMVRGMPVSKLKEHAEPGMIPA